MVVSVSRNEFSRNTYVFNSEGKDYLFLANKTHIFELDSETKKIFKSLTSSTEENIPSSYVASQNPELSLYEVETNLLALNDAISTRPLSKKPEVDIGAVSFTLTNKCNLNCTYCYQKDQQRSCEELSLPVIKDTLNHFVKDKPSFKIRFYGGEPLLQWELIKDTVAFANTNFPSTKFTYLIFTNGTLLTEEIIDFLALNNFEVDVSVDGPEKFREKTQKEKTSDPFSNFEKTLRSLTARIKSSRLRSHTVITEDNLDLNILVPYLRELGFKRLLFAPRTSKDPSLTGRIIEKWTHSLEQFLSAPSNRKYLDLFDEIEFYKALIAEQKINHHFCGAGFNYLNIDASGEFFLCHRFVGEDSYKLGSSSAGLDYEKAKTLLASADAETRLNGCENCWARYLCAGGCKGRNHLKNTSVFKANSDFCALIKTNIALSLKKYILEKA